jgi:hypothetical protein
VDHREVPAGAVAPSRLAFFRLYTQDTFKVCLKYFSNYGLLADMRLDGTPAPLMDESQNFLGGAGFSWAILN